MRWIFPIALLLALLTPAYADDWWRDQPAPRATAAAPSVQTDPPIEMIAPIISPLNSPIEALLQPEFCEKHGLTGDDCRKQWLAYLASLPPWKKP